MNTELLTDEHMRKLFGTNYNGITYFNYDTGRWFHKTWDTIKILAHDRPIFQDFKKHIESAPHFAPYELVALVVMPIQHTPNYKNFPILVSNPTYTPRSSYIVGTIIRRDRTSGKILPVPTTWHGVKDFSQHFSALEDGPFFFAFDCIKFPILTNALLKIHGNQK